MKLNHLNLSVPNVAELARFFEEFFGFRCVERKGQDVLVVLQEEAGFSLILSNFDRDVTPDYPKDFHLGFLQERKEQVEAIYQRLHAAGHAAQPPRGMHGSWGFYFTAPGKILVEVSCPMAASETRSG